MDPDEFRKFGKAAIDYVADYLENIRDCDVLPSVEPGYLHKLLPTEIPEKAEDWKIILEDVEKVIKPGITHWQSPNFHAYYPTATSYPSIVGEILSAGFGIVGFSWICSPACTELEAIVMDWVAKLLNLPDIFLNSSEGPGGGVIQGSASEAILVALMAAREKTVRYLKTKRPTWTESDIRGRLIAYSSDQSNSCVEKAGLLAAVPIKLIPTGDDLVLRGENLQKAIQEDTANGKIPIICIATLGTTGTCAYDDIQELVPICQTNNVWLHVDAAYAGIAFALPEWQHLTAGLDEVDSLNFNLHKIMMVNFDCCAMWLRNAMNVVDNFNVDRIYLKHNFEGQSQHAPDYRHWQIPLGRRFRALKVWTVLRTIGAEGIRAHFRKHLALAERFETHLKSDNRFEVLSRSLGLVCFKPKGDNQLTKALLEQILAHKKIYLIQASHKGNNFLRFAICGLNPQEKDVDFAWNEISNQLSIINENQKQKTDIFMSKSNEKISNKLSCGAVLNDCEKGK